MTKPIAKHICGCYLGSDVKMHWCDNHKKNKDLAELMFMEDGATPRCIYCGNAMQNYTPSEGRFRGQLQEHSWICDCADFPKNIVVSVG